MRVFVQPLVVLLIAALTVDSFEHLKHKLKLKKLAKLAFVAKLLTPHIIPIPIPLPIIKHQKREEIKIVEDEPWKGGWNFEGGWNMNDWKGNDGWESSQPWMSNGGLPQGWQQGRHLQNVEVKELNEHHFGHNDQSSQGSHSHHNFQPFEVREEILPALKAAGFVMDSNGELSKTHYDEPAKTSAGSPWQNSPWPEQRGARMNDDWVFPGKQQNNRPITAEVHEATEVGEAKIIEHPFDVKNADAGMFDVSNVQIKAIQAPPVKGLSQMDPWPRNVDAHSQFSEQSSQHSAVQFPHGGQMNFASGFDNIRLNDRIIFRNEHHHAQDSRPPVDFLFPKNEHGSELNSRDWESSVNSKDWQQPEQNSNDWKPDGNAKDLQAEQNSNNWQSDVNAKDWRQSEQDSKDWRSEINSKGWQQLEQKPQNQHFEETPKDWRSEQNSKEWQPIVMTEDNRPHDHTGSQQQDAHRS